MKLRYPVAASLDGYEQEDHPSVTIVTDDVGGAVSKLRQAAGARPFRGDEAAFVS